MPFHILRPQNFGGKQGKTMESPNPLISEIGAGFWAPDPRVLLGQDLPRVQGTSGLDVHSKFHLRTLAKPELEFPARQTGMLQSFGVDPLQGLVHDFSEPASVVGPGQEVNHDLFGADFQDAGGLGQVAKVIVIVPEIVVGFLERLQCLVEEVAGGDS